MNCSTNVNLISRAAVTVSLMLLFCLPSQSQPPSQLTLGGVNLGKLTNYLFVFTNGSVDANWEGASKGYIGDVAINGDIASERNSGTIAYSGTIYTNDNSLGSWQNIVDQNSTPTMAPSQAFRHLSQNNRISGLTTDLNNAFSQINALTATPGYTSRSASSLNGLNTQDGLPRVYVINITSGFNISSPITITGDMSDIFILRWDTDANPANGYQGQVKFQSGGAIVPAGALKATNFINVAGDISSSGGGSTPPLPYPQGPRDNDGAGTLVTNGTNFSGGGYFTGYWLTTGDPSSGETSSLSNAIFIGGWFSSTNKFSMTSGTSGVHIDPPALCSVGDLVWIDINHNGKQNGHEPGVPGVSVALKNGLGNIIATTITDENGKYIFRDLAPDHYSVVFPTALSGYSLTDEGIDPTDTTDSKASPVTGETPVVSLAGFQQNTSMDAGFVLSSGTLPVTLVSISATWVNDKAAINWVTSSELNLSHFVVERSFDGTNFTEAGIVFANGNPTDRTSYSFSDNPGPHAASLIYYRLRMVDIDGKGTYSETRIIRIGDQKGNEITILSYPNPASNELRITIPAAWQNKNVMFEVFTIQGQIVSRLQSENSGQTQSIDIGKLERGMYVVKVSCLGVTVQQKVIKQ